jgi:hypothetical protein
MPSFITTLIRRELGEEVEIEVEVEYDYHAGEPRSWDGPGEAEYCEITQINDLTEGLHDIRCSDADLARLETLALHERPNYEPEYERD